MPTIAARQALTAMWPIIHTARDRMLNEDELKELRRLCEILRDIPDRDAFNQAAGEFCLEIHSEALLQPELRKLLE